MTDSFSLLALDLPCQVYGVKDVPADMFISSYARTLKKQGKVPVPEWVDYVKTGVARELPPYDPDWLYVRLASLARKIYIRPGMGVGSFMKVYGKKNRKGVAPGHYSKASGKINRYCVQQLEKLGIVETNYAKGGRRITRTGMQELDTVAVEAANKKEFRRPGAKLVEVPEAEIIA